MEHVRIPSARRLAGLGLAGAVAVAAVTVTASPAIAEAPVLGAGKPNAIPGAYIVVLKDKAPGRPADLAAQHGVKIKHTYSHALRGFSADMSEQAASRLAANPAVAFVEQDAKVSLEAIQPNPPSWGLDRSDQRDLPLDNTYGYPDSGGAGVTAYIIDTGIRTTHADFGGRAVWGTNTTGDSTNTDCNGHGTHVAGTVGGTAYGVAKRARLVAVKVLNCAGSGTFSGVAAGIDFVTGHHQAGAPAVANMSLGATGSDAVTETAVRNSIADGVTYAIASGNDNVDACTQTPARVAEAITVNASTNVDARASFSNFGTCTDIFAPGQDITSAWHASDTATNTISGTSMATPHVAGAAALLLGEAPTLTPAQVRDQLVVNSTPNKITNPGAGSPNRLLFVPPPAPSGAPAVTNPGDKTGTVGTPASLQLSASGGAQPYTWSATGLPPGLSINSSSGLITGTPTTAGTFSVTVTARDTANMIGSTSFSWTINTPPTPGCAGTNGTDVQIPDLGTVESLVTVSGCSGNASAASTVEVHIVHSFRGDLVVNLVAPDGSLYLLQNRTGGSADNIDQTYTVNLSGEVANGTWRLRAQDAASADTGFINSWTLNLGGGPSACGPVTNGTDVQIPDLGTVESLVTVSGCSGNASAASTVEVHIVHSFRGDLVVNLVAPDGSLYLLQNRTGGSADNIDQTYTVNLSGEVANGTWRLRAQDAASADTGFINSWTLDV